MDDDRPSAAVATLSRQHPRRRRSAAGESCDRVRLFGETLTVPDLRDLVVDLQTHGARFEAGVDSSSRRGGAGPTDSKPFVLDGMPFAVPTLAPFVAASPYTVREAGPGYVVTRDGVPVTPVTFPRRPRFYDLATADGIPYWKIALLHGVDTLATTVVQTCIRWNDPAQRCQFCGIGLSLESDATISVKQPGQLAEVARAAVDLDGVKSFTMTMGTVNETDKGTRYIARCVRAVKAVVDLPIEVQFEPPEDLADLAFVRDAGADSVGIHIESFDQAVRDRVTPGKARVSVERYFETFERAVELFGEGQVSSYVIVGLGESTASILRGCQRLVDMGVFPFVVPLRPIMGTQMEHVVPPAHEVMTEIYEAVDAMMASRGLSAENALAGCVRCGACSALPAYERRRLHDSAEA
jgi:radical SAM protein (TIGR04043 family)